MNGMTGDFSLTAQQRTAMERMEEFIASPERQIFILKGYAGTGKTTLIRPLLDLAGKMEKTCLLMAPTGRAAKILKDKTGFEATTIHKAIYELSGIEAVEGNENEESKLLYRFPLRQPATSRRPGPMISPGRSLLIVDESSMISSRKSVSDLFVFGSGILLNDILQFARLEEGGKIIFVGDPAQLPPVGDPDSFALDAGFLREKGFDTSSFELTEVIRQAADSPILRNAIKLRSLLQSTQRRELILDRKDGEVEDIRADAIASRFCEISPTPCLDGPVVICFANKTAAAYNNEIRGRYFPGKTGFPQLGDRLIIVGNNYSAENREVLNGEFATIVDVSGQIDVQYGIVYLHEDGAEKTKPVRLELRFIDARLQFEDGTIVHKKLLYNLLDSSNPSITYQEQCALASNFHLRHKGMKVNSPEYAKALMQDPYYNAVRAKYGYAITCHKAQGGEWDTTFVDFSGRTGISTDCLRWSYTASTRARKRMFGYLLHNLPPFKAKVTPIVKISIVPEEYYPAASIPAGPFHRDSDPAPLKAKYWQVADALEDSGFRISGIAHKPFREIYSFTDSEGRSIRLDAIYNKALIFKPFHTAGQESVPEELLSLINSAGNLYPFPISYTPSLKSLEDLFHKIGSSCDDIGIHIVNIVEHLDSYKVIYYLKTEAAFAYLSVFFNKSGQITYIAPASADGANDRMLITLSNTLIES